jgi:hypothetical protein
VPRLDRPCARPGRSLQLLSGRRAAASTAGAAAAFCLIGAATTGAGISAADERQQASWLYESPCVAVLENPDLSNPPFVGYSGRLVYAQPRDCFAAQNLPKEPSS